MPSKSCPRCGETFDGDDIDDAENSVVAHMTSKIDDDHSGIGYKKALRMLEYGPDNDSDNEISEDEPQISEDSDSDSDMSRPSATDGGRRAPPQPDLEVDDEDDEDGGCPECGNDGIPTDDLFGHDDVDEQVAEYLARNFDRFCPACSTARTAEVWSE